MIENGLTEDFKFQNIIFENTSSGRDDLSDLFALNYNKICNLEFEKEDYLRIGRNREERQELRGNQVEEGKIKGITIQRIVFEN